jgi:DNA-binding CsgD family transcriptional regulator
MLCLCLATGGKREMAIETMDELDGLLSELPGEVIAAGYANAYLCRCALILGDEDRLRRFHARLLPSSGRFHDASIDRILGEAELQLGDLSAAAAHLEAAERHCRAESLLWDLASTLQSRARLLSLEPTTAAEAAALRAEAAALFTSLGNQAAATVLSAPPESEALPAGLSQREVDVLRLLAAGRSNLAIAQQLFLSEKTIENHLTSIYRKTAADNRAAAAAFAVRHGLA